MFLPRITDLYPMRESNAGNEGGTTETPDANAGGQQGGEGESKPFATFPDKESFMARVSRESQSQMLAKAKELGFDSVADMEAAIKAAQTKADEEKSELDKAKEAAAKAASDKDAAISRANDRLIRAEVKSIAADLEIVDGEAAYALMDRSSVAVDDDGNVTGVKEALDALLSAKPYLKGQPQSSRSGGDFTKGNGDGNKNPWSKEHLNLTEQARILRENPALAKQLQATAKG